MAETQATVAERQAAPTGLIVALLAGAAVSTGLGVYGRVHDGTGDTLVQLFFAGQIQLKAWFATVAVALALFQITSALRIYGKVNWPPSVPSWFGEVHRLSGTLAFLFSLPVAYHCLWSIGFNADFGTSRVFIHSLAGCLFYGAFAAKILVVRNHSLPGWALPIAGGIVFTLLVTIWLTSSMWFFTNFEGALF